VALRDWVGAWPDVPTSQAQRRAIEVLGQTLDRLRPLALDRATSTVAVLEGEDQDEREEDRRGDGIAVTLRHTQDLESTLEIDIWPDQALIRWLDETHNTRDHCGDAADGEWSTYAAEVVADILAGRLAVDRAHFRGRWRRTRVLDVRDPANPERLWQEVGPALWWLFVTPLGAMVVRRRVDFDLEVYP
jgi:hypothetical protein